MEYIYCQSCGILLENSTQYGTHADHSPTSEYCSYCYQEGEFTEDCTMEEMILHCVEYLDEFNEGSRTHFSREEAIREMRKHFPTLKRWQQKQETENYYHQAVNKVVDYINTHLFEAIDLKKLSDISHISRCHFVHIHNL
ncbi:MAG: hypothetical protein LUD15_08045 [Bacteroides sp.]|nr:hypothetical protein [Bacteroides sp.]